MMYTEEFKKGAVQKFLSRGSRRAWEIGKEIGVADSTLYEWRKKYGTSLIIMDEARRPQDWSLDQKCKAVFEFEKLTEDLRGEFLRKEGLHTDHLVQWKKEIQDCFIHQEGAKNLTKIEKAQFKRQIKELQMDLKRKEKALAETAALLILKKKADLIWGTEESE